METLEIGSKKKIQKTKLKYKKLLDSISQNALLLIILVLGIIMSIVSPSFLNIENITNLLFQCTIMGIMAIGVTYVLITGGIDLSIEGLVTVSACLGTGLIVKSGFPVSIGIIFTILIGVVFGAINGYFVSKIKIEPLIITLGMSSLAMGIVWVYTEGALIHPVPGVYINIARARILGIPFLIVFMIILYIFNQVILSKTTYGRCLFMLGGNEEAARMAGIITDKIKITAYIMSGLYAGIAAIISVARFQAASPRAAEGTLLTVIAAVVIGGTRLSGGYGTILGTLFGVVLIQMISNIINLLEIPPTMNELVKGLIIVFAALIDRYRIKR